jgi:hypothetical protein
VSPFIEGTDHIAEELASLRARVAELTSANTTLWETLRLQGKAGAHARIAELTDLLRRARHWLPDDADWKIAQPYLDDLRDIDAALEKQ